MTELSREIFNGCHVRKSRAQKDKFIETIKKYYPDATVEEGGMVKSRNVIIGDVASAKAVFSAHYDTCAVMLMPNFLMPKNIFISVLYSILAAVPVFVAAVLAAKLMSLVTDSFWAAYFAEIAVMFGGLGLMMFGKANKATANDNTSGVATLCELMAAMDDDTRRKYAFVFFDHEEAGLLGSAQFAKLHKNEMKDKLLINFDCVSDGDNIMFILNKKAQSRFKSKLTASFEREETKNVIVSGSENTFHPSDQVKFPVNVGVAAFNRNRLGLYVDKIHTSRDTVFDETNIQCIVNGMIKFTEK